MGQLGEIALKTNDNKILATPQGNPLQENYQFGNAIGSNVSNIQNYVKISALNAPLLTFGFFVNIKIGNNCGLFKVVQTDGSLTQAALYANTNLVITSDQNGSNYLYVGGGNPTRGTILVRVEFNAGSFKVYLNNIQIVSIILASSANVDYIQIGDGTILYNTNSYGIGNYFTYLTWFFRLMDTPETVFMYNNRSGRFPLKPSLTTGMINFNTAEVLDFSTAQDGSDMRVGFRAVLGTKHGEILNIPAAASLQAKADYINNTFIQSFI